MIMIKSPSRLIQKNGIKKPALLGAGKRYEIAMLRIEDYVESIQVDV